MTSPLQPVPLICFAIEQKRMLRLIYHNKGRTIESHDHGILNGSLQLLGYQVAGSSSRPLPNWLLMKTLGGHLKTGHRWTLQNRPTKRRTRTTLFITWEGAFGQTFL